MIDTDSLSGINLNQPRVHHNNIGDDINFAEHSLDNSMPPGNLYGNNDYPGMSMFSAGFNVAQNCKNQVMKMFYPNIVQIILKSFWFSG